MIEVDAREDGKYVCVRMYVCVCLKNGFRRMAEKVKNEIEPQERFLYEVCVRVSSCVWVCACRWVNCRAHNSPAVPH